MTVAATRIKLEEEPETECWEWDMNAQAAGDPVRLTQHADCCVQVGTTGSVYNGSTIAIQGSNDNVGYANIREAAAGGALSYTTGIEVRQVLEKSVYIRPNATVAAPTSVKVRIFFRKNYRSYR